MVRHPYLCLQCSISRRSLLVAVLLPTLSNRFDERLVDLVELNHFFDSQAKLIFDQVIWWEWINWISEYRVIDWRINSSAHPRYDYHRSAWKSLWKDKQHYRCVYARDYRETWTQYDPEIEDREKLPCKLRTGL